jgi:hypothetical protein
MNKLVVLLAAGFTVTIFATATPAYADVTAGRCYDLGQEFAEEAADDFCSEERRHRQRHVDYVDCITEYEEDYKAGCERRVVDLVRALYEQGDCENFETYEGSRLREFALRRHLCQ